MGGLQWRPGKTENASPRAQRLPSLGHTCYPSFAQGKPPGEGRGRLPSVPPRAMLCGPVQWAAGTHAGGAPGVRPTHLLPGGLGARPGGSGGQLRGQAGTATLFPGLGRMQVRACAPPSQRSFHWRHPVPQGCAGPGWSMSSRPGTWCAVGPPPEPRGRPVKSGESPDPAPSSLPDTPPPTPKLGRTLRGGGGRAGRRRWPVNRQTLA